jgi:hypothetical protein
MVTTELIRAKKKPREEISASGQAIWPQAIREEGLCFLKINI